MFTVLRHIRETLVKYKDDKEMMTQEDETNLIVLSHVAQNSLTGTVELTQPVLKVQYSIVESTYPFAAREVCKQTAVLRVHQSKRKKQKSL